MRLEKASLPRSLTWDILVFTMDFNLTRLSIEVMSQGACRGMSFQLSNALFAKAPFGRFKTRGVSEGMDSDNYGSISVNDVIVSLYATR